MAMQAWKIRYCSTENPTQRWTAGILGLSKEDSLRHLSTVITFPYQVENVEYLGDVHAISEPVLMGIVKAQQAKNPPKKEEPKVEEKKKEEEEKKEDPMLGGEVECAYCGRVCKGANALAYHEARCKQNPDYERLEAERKEKKNAKKSK